MVGRIPKTLAALSVCVYTAAVATTPPTPIVNLGYSTYEGILVQDAQTNQTNINFLGVRYAASPTGTLRFRAAQTPAFTSGVQTASAQPAMCLQAGAGSAASTPLRNSTSSDVVSRATESLAPSEDCLFLNVFVPGSDIVRQKSLPVVFWIHGGGYVGGSASQFTGNDILRESGGGVVLVIIQYRLGLFGFLPGQKVKDGGQLNAGLQDQQFALKWAQEHITKFGGDPTKVTIWGQSAGAGSVIQHLVANGGRTTPPLFRAAITSSTFLPSQYSFNDRIPESLYSQAVSQTNCTSAKDTLECLRAADVNTLQAANTEINSIGFFGTFVFVPVVDGTFITERPTETIRKGVLNAKFLLSVTNTFEGTAFVNQATANTVETSQFVTQLFPELEMAGIAEATAQYTGLGTNIFQADAIMGESIFICPTYLLLRAFGQNAFKGEFAIPPGLHGEDVAFYFPSTNSGGVPSFADPGFDKAFPDVFLDFALALNPNVKLDPTNVTPLWKPWDGSNEMLFNKTEANAADIRLISTSSALLERCNFWESVSEQTAQ
ncbi:hypothetical protein HYPSUDRAFT_147970 [Hypholoma sublateritium FD-334 SS-4]|uniref:Carboxylic ester hydrolase n=1 Tax=Hypholoma sublateritium (strain FD-334 SS-4) TaxID=945553 RepID=A0A0D2NHZ9_HYPSF|nr:hypothetical protein HYPSUDRAFT_147970 [Hypholoma sublateritium FD-334 SS-4]